MKSPFSGSAFQAVINALYRIAKVKLITQPPIAKQKALAAGHHSIHLERRLRRGTPCAPLFAGTVGKDTVSRVRAQRED
jgi:hypothetical protein